MTTFKTPQTQPGFTQYIVLGVVLVLVAGAMAFFQFRKHVPSPDDLRGRVKIT